MATEAKQIEDSQEEYQHEPTEDKGAYRFGEPIEVMGRARRRGGSASYVTI